VLSNLIQVLKMYFCVVKWLKNILDFFINSSIWVAIAVTALIEVTYFNLEVAANENLLFAAFFGTIFGYNFIKHFEKEQVKGISFEVFDLGVRGVLKQFEKLTLLQKVIFQLSVISALVVFALFFRFHIKTQLVLLISSVLTFCYAVSLGYSTLRNISGIKIYVVALVWAFVTVLLPVLEGEIEFTSDVWILLLQRFVFVIVLILPFDIRDLSVDDKKLGTMPQKIGVQKTKFYGLFLLMVFFFLEFFKDEVLAINTVILPLVFLVTVLFLTLAKEKQPKYYASFFVEGIPVLWFGLLMVL